MTVTKCVYGILDSKPREWEFSGWLLFDEVVAMGGFHSYPSTLLDMVRNWCSITGNTLICIDRKKSKYRLTKDVCMKLGTNCHFDK